MTMHGGPDALGAAVHDFSTNANAAGPCPLVLARLQALMVDTYPDPCHDRLVAELAAWHGVDRRQIVIGASASELIGRLTAALVSLHGRQLPVFVPAHAYGDYARAATAWGLACSVWDGQGGPASTKAPTGGAADRYPDGVSGADGMTPSHDNTRRAALRPPPREQQENESGARLFWACEPASPLGGLQPGLAALADNRRPDDLIVVDRVYAPLQLQAQSSLPAARWAQLWQIHSPNKALGLTGIRGAWLLAPADAPEALLERLHGLAPSWPLGSHASQMLHDWLTPAVQDWVAGTLPLLRDWKQGLVDGLRQRGWQVRDSLANFFCARPPAAPGPLAGLLARLRQRDIKLRDAASFGLNGEVRLGVRRPQDQEVLWHALDA